MKILRREELWIHTHFVTNCRHLPDHHARAVQRDMARVLDELGIVFGIHYDSSGEDGLRIVLECIPLPETMRRIESALAAVLKPIPARPRRTTVEVEPPGSRPSGVKR